MNMKGCLCNFLGLYWRISWPAFGPIFVLCLRVPVSWFASACVMYMFNPHAEPSPLSNTNTTQSRSPAVQGIFKMNKCTIPQTKLILDTSNNYILCVLYFGLGHGGGWMDRWMDVNPNHDCWYSVTHCTKDVKTMLKTNIVIRIMSVKVKQRSRWIGDHLRSVYNSGNLLNSNSIIPVLYTNSTICKVLLNMHAWVWL
jgi:hypothetical protein